MQNSGEIQYGLQQNPANYLLNNILLTPLAEGSIYIAPEQTLIAHEDHGWEIGPGLDSAGITGQPDKVEGQPRMIWLPWSSDGGNWVQLPDVQGSPDLFLTGRLTGCAISVRSLDGMLQVAHYNIQLGDPEFNCKSLRTAIDTLGSIAIWNTQSYMTNPNPPYEFDGDYTANVVGVRRDQRWELYAQRLVSTDEVLFVRDVVRLY